MKSLALKGVVLAFAESTLKVQNYFLVSHKTERIGRKPAKVHFVLSQPMGRSCFCELLAVSKARVTRQNYNKVDLRSAANKNRTARKDMHCKMWFVRKWMQLAEPLPNKLEGYWGPASEEQRKRRKGKGFLSGRSRRMRTNWLGDGDSWSSDDSESENDNVTRTEDEQLRDKEPASEVANLRPNTFNSLSQLLFVPRSWVP